MNEHLKQKLGEIRERLMDPFNVEYLEKDFKELYELIKKAPAEDTYLIKKEFEEIRKLLFRNLSLIAGGLKPLLEREKGSLFSRRV